MSHPDDAVKRSVSARIFALLDVVAEAATPPTLSAIARDARLPVSTVHRLLGDLLRSGALVRTADGGYQLGERIWRLGVAAPWEREFRAAAATHAHGLARRTGSAVAFSALDGTRLICLDSVAGHWETVVLSRSGDALPTAATSAGKILLAGAAKDRAPAVLSGRLPPFTPFTPVAPGLVRSQLDRAARVGYATAHAEYVDGEWSVSSETTSVIPAAVCIARCEARGSALSRNVST
ncbi:helix-turn-helix domain-containing protein [Amycolatopsis sp. DSM 110486]|nr:helix-turn-helix domain-containing protein [Amycolatopsis sp. DSM 110486]QYN20504.1 helix-turn-helix domain-containing protein [Amycolatopsis sp. DSM 110486]